MAGPLVLGEWEPPLLSGQRVECPGSFAGEGRGAEAVWERAGPAERGGACGKVEGPSRLRWPRARSQPWHRGTSASGPSLLGFGCSLSWAVHGFAQLVTDELCAQGRALGLWGLRSSAKTSSDRVTHPPPHHGSLLRPRWFWWPLGGYVTCPPGGPASPQSKGLVLCPAAGLRGLLARGLPHCLHLPFPPRRPVLPGVPR